MTIDEELSIIKDNLAEYGQTNITQEYKMIYNSAIDDMINNLSYNSRIVLIDGNAVLVVEEYRIRLVAEMLKEHGNE